MLSSINVTKSTIMRIIKESIMSKGKVTNDGKVIQSSNKKVQGEGKTNGETGSQREVHVDSFTINVFFDGTKNNLYNIEHRKKNPQMYKGKETASSYESYFNDHSNVSYLYQARKQVTNVGWAYIEGIGTGADDINALESNNRYLKMKGKPLEEKKYYTDSTMGFAYGTGPTGIKRRVQQSFEKIQTMVSSDLGNRIPTILVLNVFGFSRGAAAARHFVHKVKTQPRSFIGWNLTRERIIVNFVGLFDTVSSYSGTGSPDPELTGAFDDDVKDLHLNFERDYARKVFHLTAADEYRLYFSLTNINSAIRHGFGMEVAISGAHADVGGSYASAVQKSFPVRKNVPGMKNWFQNQGFFKENDINWLKSRTYQTDMGAIETPETMTATRKHIIPNDYARVAFKIMRLVVETHCSDKSIAFDRDIIKKRETSNFPEIIELLNELPYKIQKVSKGSWGQSYNFELSKYYSPEQVRKIRYKYIHWSAKDELGYELRTKNGLPYRVIHKG